ncbi:uncharacterized protein LOC141720971 [Apium graveolens]|uniref:uncharacterized protein LOC141720971 n=1 Tax=Apium graveolens TaxID=4045 RepID=UPI003D7B361F
MEGAAVNQLGEDYDINTNTIIATNQGDVDQLDLPPGFRFHPTNEELITHYLVPKVVDSNFTSTAIGEVNLNRCEPWDLPKKAKMGEEEWYFFCQRDRKYPTGTRTNRATGTGYWKATGKDKEIYSKTGNSSRKKLVGMKKTLVFYKGRAPKGEKMDWVMHEFRLEGNYSFPNSAKDEWVVCRVIHKKATMITKPSSMLDLTRMNSFIEGLLDSPLSPPPLSDSPFPAKNERPNALKSSNINNINTSLSNIQDSRGTALANYPANYPIATKSLDANTLSVYYHQPQMLPQHYSSTSFNPSTNYDRMPNSSIYYSQNPYHTSATTLDNLLHQQRLDDFVPNIPGSYNPPQITDEALPRHCKVEQFSSNQSMLSRSQDTGLSTDVTTEISSAKNNRDDVGSFHEIEDGPLSDLDSFWSC